MPADWAATILGDGPKPTPFPADAVLAALQATSIPILHVGGDHDIVFPVENWNALLPKLPTVQLLTYAQAGHGPQHQFPASAAAHIAAFARTTP